MTTGARCALLGLTLVVVGLGEPNGPLSFNAWSRWGCGFIGAGLLMLTVFGWKKRS